jgi:hypothetical protein
MTGSRFIAQIVGQLADHMNAEAAHRALVDRLVHVDGRREERIERAGVILDLDAEFGRGEVKTNDDPPGLVCGIAVMDEVGEVFLEGDVEVRRRLARHAVIGNEPIQEMVDLREFRGSILDRQFHRRVRP